MTPDVRHCSQTYEQCCVSCERLTALICFLIRCSAGSSTSGCHSSSTTGAGACWPRRRAWWAWTSSGTSHMWQVSAIHSCRPVDKAPPKYRPSVWVIKTQIDVADGANLGEAPRKTALIQLCFATRLARPPVAVLAPLVNGDAQHSRAHTGGRRQQQPAACTGPRHTCLLLHVAHTGITPTLANLLASPQVLSA